MADSDADPPAEAGDDTDGESEWRFSLADLEESPEAVDELEPGSPTVENTVFVLLGVAATFAVVALVFL